MSTTTFYDSLQHWPQQRVAAALAATTAGDVERALFGRGKRDSTDLLALLSPAATPYLEAMAQAACTLTRQRFGNVVQFYVPLYVSNHCINACKYCGFNRHNKVRRSHLSLDDAVREATFLSAQGFRHLLLVSGEDPRHTPVEYFEQLVRQLRPLFSSLNIEIYPLSEPDYRRLVLAGVDSLTVYQESYDPDVYAQFHDAGPKRDYQARLQAVERGARAGVTFLGIGALLGLNDWRHEAFAVGLHAQYLQRRYWRQHVSVSFPRMRHAAGGFTPPFPADDAALTQIITALRLFLPDAGLVLSTREAQSLREQLLPLGITRISAGSKTTPGGYDQEEPEAEAQFQVQDHRSLAEVMHSVRELGFDPVCKDWDNAYRTS